MKKLLVAILFICINLYANSYKYVENILGKPTFNKYRNLIKASLNKNASLEETLVFLKNNALINLYFKKIKTIHPIFIFENNNPVFNTKTLYDSLKVMGYYYFYPIKIEKNSKYKLQLETMSQNYIDPLEFLKQLEKRGCTLKNIKKRANNFTYYISCSYEKIINTAILKEDIQALHKINGIYWIEPDNFSKIYISTSKYDFWHPYVVFYDKNLNILNIISTSDLIRKKTFKIPQKCKYIKVTDSFTKENIKRGIFVKGLK